MRRKFATNLIFLLAANLLVKPFWILGIDRVVQNQVGAGAYGTYFAVFNYSFLLSIMLDFGINNFNNRAVSRNNKRTGEYMLNLLFLKFILAILYFSVTLISAVSTGFSDLQIKMLVLLAVNQILLSVILYFRSNLAALQLFKTDSFISVFDRLLAILFCLVLLYSGAFANDFNILWFIYAQSVALMITAIVAGVILARKAVLKMALWKFRFTKLILLQSMPFALLGLLMGIYYRIDAVMIERLLPDGAHEAGIYAASFKLLDAINQFGFLFATLLLPLFSGMIKRKDNVNQLVLFSSELMFVLALITGASCYFFRLQIMHMLYHAADNYWAEIFGWLILNFIPMSSIYVFGTLLTANGNLKILNYIALGGMLLNVCLNFLLIPRYGALGATFATLITQLIVAIIHILVAIKQFNFHYRMKDLIRYLTFTLLSIGILFLSTMFPFHWMLNFGLASVICLGFAVWAKLVPLHQLLSLLKSKSAS